MYGMLLWKASKTGSREKAVTVRERSILHVRFMCAEILRGEHTPETILRRRIVGAAKRLRKQGVTQIVLPENFFYHVLLLRQGITSVSTTALRQLVAADWVRWALRRKNVPSAGARVAVSAARLTGEVVRTVTELALRHRYVLLDLPYGGEELCRQLRREYGVSLLLNPSVEQLNGADSLLLFDMREDCEITPAALKLYDEDAVLPPLSLPPALEEKLPKGVERGQLLSVLREAGILRPGQIHVGGTDSAEFPLLLRETPP